MGTQSPITWFGGKSRLAAQIIRYFPNHKIYTEVFGGSAAVLLAKDPAPVEVYNDLNGDVVNFFRVLREPRSFNRLQRSLEHTLCARSEFELAQEPTDDPVEAARRFMVLQRQSFAGKGKEWGFSVAKAAAGIASSVRRWQAGVERISAVHMRLRSVQIENDDWWTVMGRYDTPDTLHFLDPPYVPSLRVNGGYTHELSEHDHKILVSRIRTVAGMVILCGYNHQFIHGPLEGTGWTRIDNQVITHTSDRRAGRFESLWLSPSLVSRLENGVVCLSPRDRMRQGAYQLHRMRVRSTTRRIQSAIERLRRSGKKPSMAGVARLTSLSPEHLSRKYRHLFS